MDDQVFDIFSGDRASAINGGNAPVWVEQVNGYDAAIARMRRIANEKPGSYFVFCAATNKVVALIKIGQHKDKSFRAAG